MSQYEALENILTWNNLEITSLTLIGREQNQPNLTLTSLYTFLVVAALKPYKFWKLTKFPILWCNTRVYAIYIVKIMTNQS